MTTDVTISPIIKYLGCREYIAVWQEMKTFTETRTATTPDQLWVLEHEPVYTLGLNSDKKHILKNANIPIVQVDRGGQVTYHAPGQLIIYPLLDLKRQKWSITHLVDVLQNAVIQLLEKYEINAHLIQGAPGVYVEHKKIASLGIRVKKNGSYHGLSLNVNMDLTPFENINPCGYTNLKMTQLVDLGCAIDILTVSQDLSNILSKSLSRKITKPIKQNKYI